LRERELAGREVIGFIDSFYRYEGLDLLIKAFTRIAGEHADATLLLVGGSEVEEDLNQPIAGLGLNSRVVKPGGIPHENVPMVYAMIEILVYPR
jgi:glycosyltransferase involved in cell wall biosynthesis